MAEFDASISTPIAPEPAGGLTDPDTERVLLATDGGGAGSAAIRWLAHRAGSRRLDIEVVSVVDLDTQWAAYYGEDVAAEAENVVRQEKAALLHAAPDARVRTAVGRGNARSVLEAASAVVDMLVVGSNRTSPRRGVFDNSFSVKVAEGARCPVVVVPKDWQPSDGPVVVGVQGDASDDPALAFAIREARMLDTTLRLVKAWAMPGFIAVGPDTAEAEKRQESALTALLTGLRGANPELTVVGMLVEGDPAESLLDEAGGAALLVVGSHSRTLLDRFFLGSVSREILREPPCAVAVVRPGTEPRRA